MDKKLPKLLPKPTISDLKVNTLFSAITAKAIENGFSAQEVRDDNMRWLVIPAPPENMNVPNVGPRKECVRLLIDHEESGWATYWPPPNNLDAQNIDATLCTHLVFAFADLSPNSTQMIASSSRELAMYKPFTNLKNKNPQLKTMLAVGGWKMGSRPFMYVVQSADHMHQFANNTVRFLRQYNFDGLDIDWEYPASRGSPPEDKHRFSQLLNIVRSAFDDEQYRGSKDRLLLSVAVGVGVERANESYEIQEIARHTDFINLMMYDFHGQWEETINGHHSSLYSKDNFNIICALIKAKNVTEHILTAERVPYIVDGDLWVGYDNTQSITEKVGYIKNNRYGGVMVWAVDLDDTTGVCGGGPYPLMNAIKNGFLVGTGAFVG